MMWSANSAVAMAGDAIQYLKQIPPPILLLAGAVLCALPVAFVSLDDRRKLARKPN